MDRAGETDAQREEADMHGAARGLVVLAGALMLTQACATIDASRSDQSDASASSAPGTPSYGIAGGDRYFKVEWSADERKGRPMVSGYVTNTSGWGMRNVRLRVESLDAAGAVAATDIGYVNTDITAGSRVYYEVPVRAKAASYRVSVLSFDQVQGFGN